jgi:ABC-type nitrate/sulfonate/bicarbonate transport system substrate-binding protein
MKRKSSVYSICILLLSLVIPSVSFGGAASGNLRLALLPIPDVLPVYVAEEKGIELKVSKHLLVE